jgi:hypothetical protein
VLTADPMERSWVEQMAVLKVAKMVVLKVVKTAV